MHNESIGITPAWGRFTSGLHEVIVWCSRISSVLIIILMFLVTADVIGRGVFNSPLPGTLESGEAMMVFIVFLAYAHTEAAGQHIRIQLIDNHVTQRQLGFTNIFAYLVGIFVYGIICWLAWGQALESLAADERMVGTLRLPVYPAKFVLVWGSLLLVVQFVTELVSTLGKIRRDRSRVGD